MPSNASAYPHRHQRPFSHIDQSVPIMVFFWSRTCGHSRRMDSLVDHFVRMRRGAVRLAKIELSERADLARRFGVEHAPTVLLLRDLREVERLEGRSTLPGIKAAIEPHLEIAEPIPALQLVDEPAHLVCKT